MRSRSVFIAAAAIVAALTSPASGRSQTDVPEGFTAYVLQGPGINAPPLPFRVEGDRLIAPPGGMVTVEASRIESDRATFTLNVPGGTAEFIGQRRGDEFGGFLLIVEGDERDIVPVTFTPAGREPAIQPDVADYARAPGVSRIEVVPGDATLDAGERRRFVARVYDESGNELPSPEIQWYALGQRASVDADGVFFGTGSGTKHVVALYRQALGLAAVEIAEPTIASLVVYSDVPPRLAAGSRVPLSIHALDNLGRWDLDPELEIASSDPSVVAVEGRTLVARAPGRATVTLTADDARLSYPIDVVPANGTLAITGLPRAAVRTGDVVRLATSIPGARALWAVAGTGAAIDAEGAFVAERPGSHVVVATLEDRVATATIAAEPRRERGRIRMAGHGLNLETYTSDLWPQNRYVYVGTHQANQLRTYDVSDPTTPVLTDSQAFDARVVNDVKVSADGLWLVATREGAADRRNGILVFSLADPARPALVSEYTETLTAGVHNVFWHGSLVYAVNDGTGDMHIIDLTDPASPKEIGRWGIDAPGKSLHDVWVQDGIAYLSYLGNGLVILDVGGAGMGGTAAAPVQVSRIFYPGGPTHSAIRHRDYVFVGDEDFSTTGTVPSVTGSDPRGPVHVIEVKDLAHPKYVGRYEVPEAGAHNFWVQDDRLYIGYYQGGIRVVDVSGELRGDLYAQGREIAHFLPAAGPDEAMRPFSPRVWGVFPMFGNGWVPQGEMFYATDYNSGLWSFTVEVPEEEKPIS
ncbi:MAG TPA: hypothetical protein VMR66_08125 [Gemmatimonadota bacterium]|nr:hypothetical protein [Gemmatimonadota bacterium]